MASAKMETSKDVEGEPQAPLFSDGMARRPSASSASKLSQMVPLLFPSEDPTSSTNKPVNLALLFWRFIRVAAAFFMGDAKWKARGLMAVVLVFAVSSTGVNVLVSYNQRDVTTALTEKKGPDFYAAVWKFTLICAFAAPFFALYSYIMGLMKLEWRVWLTDLLLAKYFGKKAFFDIKMEGDLDNPDQRICDDIKEFVYASVNAIVLVVEKVLNLIAFSAVLWSISPGIVFFLLGYAAVGTVFSLYVFGKKLMWLQYEQQQREADMRYSLVRVRENVESIAFYHGEQREAALVENFLSRVAHNFRRLLIWQFGLSVFTKGYEYATYMIPVLALAPSFFEGKIEYGEIVQTAMAFDQIFSAVTIIVMQFDEWTDMAAETERLESLLAALKVYSGDSSLMAVPNAAKESAASAAKEFSDEIPLNPLNSDSAEDQVPLSSSMSGAQTIVRTTGSRLSVEGLMIHLPKTREVLFPEGLSFALEDNQSLLVMGPSGCGKSSLLRAISGLWNNGQGHIECPPQRETFFLPQKPYMALGSLREQLLFPLPARTKGEALDAMLREVLQAVHLNNLLERFPNGLDEDCDWSDCLSVGEQQRIAFARLFICKPRLAFLDESTSALDTKNERHLYSQLKHHVASYVSVGHRLTLVPYHSHVLFFDEEQSLWSLLPSPEFQKLQGALLSGS